MSKLYQGSFRVCGNKSLWGQSYLFLQPTGTIAASLEEEVLGRC